MVRLTSAADPPDAPAGRGPSTPSPTWSGPPSRGPGLLALVLVGAAVLVLAGVGGLVASPDNPFLGVMGLALLGLGALAAATAVLEHRWDARRPGPRLSTDPTGAPSTLVASAPWSGRLRWGTALALVGPLGLAALLALLAGQWLAAVVLGTAALGLGTLLAPRTAPQGVHLTARGLSVVHHGRPQRADWDDVVMVTLGGFVEVQLSGGRRLRFTPRQLAVGPDSLALALSLCAQDPPTRRDLGTPASLHPGLWGLRA